MEEEVSVFDIIKLGLDGHLLLSLYFGEKRNGICGRTGELTLTPNVSNDFEEGIDSFNDQEAQRSYWHANSDRKIPRHWPIPDKQRKLTSEFSDELDLLTICEEVSIALKKEIVEVTGVWDIMMIADGFTDVLNQLEYSCDSAEVYGALGGGGIFVFRNDGCIRQIMKRYDDLTNSTFSDRRNCRSQPSLGGEIYNGKGEVIFTKEDLDKLDKFPFFAFECFSPALNFPADARFVVRTEALSDLLNLLKSPGTQEEEFVGGSKNAFVEHGQDIEALKSAEISSQNYGYLSEDHECFSLKLKAAIDAWVAVSPDFSLSGYF